MQNTQKRIPVNMPYPIPPSKHAVSDPHPVRIGWEALARIGPDDSCTLASFRTGSVWPKPDTIRQNLIGPGLLLHILIRTRLRKNATESESGKLVAGRLHSVRTGPDDFLHTSLILDQMRLDRISVGFAQYGPGLVWKNGSEYDAGR